MRSLAPAAFAALLCHGAAGCARLQPTRAEQLCDVLEHEVQAGATPSLAIAVVADGRVVFLDAQGVADPLTGRAATPETIYMFFSITKLFTATAVMTLVDDGVLDLDRPLAEYLPDLPLENPYPTALTTRHLLSHSGGLPNPPAWAWARPYDQARPRADEMLERILADHPVLVAEPGTHDEYNNLGYLILGRLIEVRSGLLYEDYVRSRVLEPLGLEHTDFVYRDAMLEHAAIGVVRRHSLYHRLFRRVAPASLFGPDRDEWATARLYTIDGAAYGGLVGTAGDLAKFLAMHLAGGSYDGRRILSPASVAAMQRPQFTRAGKPLRHALGWHTGSVAGERYFNHMGRGGGFRPAVQIYPKLGQGLVVLTNRTDYDPRPIVRRVPVAGALEGRCRDRLSPPPPTASRSVPSGVGPTPGAGRSLRP